MTAGASRVIDSSVDGRPRSAARVALGVGVARTGDWMLARLGWARPIVLVSGFWRSGTTWLQECLAESLGAKTIFEPLSPMEPKRRAMTESLFPDDEDALQAFIPASCPDDRTFWTFLDATCTGVYGSRFLLSCRRTVRESFRTGIVVKDVRLQCNLDAFHRRYGVPVVHLRRHPCAVVASLLGANWHWDFGRLRLAAMRSAFLPATAGRPALLQAFDTDALSRIAAVWALSERHVAQALRGRPWARILTYEDLLADPAARLAALCRDLHLVQVHTASFSQPSATIHPDEFAAWSRTAPDRWRQLLSAFNIARVQAIVGALYPEWREENGWEAD